MMMKVVKCTPSNTGVSETMTKMWTPWTDRLLLFKNCYSCSTSVLRKTILQDLSGREPWDPYGIDDRVQRRRRSAEGEGHQFNGLNF